MRNLYLAGQGAVSAILAWLSLRLGALFLPLAILMILMVVDYISGMLASKAEAIEHPDDPAYGWSSRKGILGILKKVGYMVVIAAAVCLDQIILRSLGGAGVEVPAEAVFGLIVTVWFVLNELLSVIENAGRMGAPVPPWLAKYIAILKGKIDQQHDPGEVDQHE